MAWINWEDLCRPMCDGGLGFKDLSLFNSALLSKWVWRFLNDENSLWKNIIVSHHEDPSRARAGPSRANLGNLRSGWWHKVMAMVEGEEGRWF